MGMVRKEVTDTSTASASPTPALPNFYQTAVTGSPSQPSLPLEDNPRANNLPSTIPSKEVGMMRGGVAHDAARITAAMSAMKSDAEVKALFTSLYEHILALVSR